MNFLQNIPIGQYVFGKSGWLRILDPRLKFSWTVVFLISPILASLSWRVALVGALFFITCFSRLPIRIWWRSIVLLVIFAGFLGLLAMFLPTGEMASSLPVRSSQELPNAIADGPTWQLLHIGPVSIWSLKMGPLVVDRRSAELGLKTSTLIFTVVHSVNLMLLTTSPEDLMWTLQWFLSPLSFLGLPIERISFQLLLAFRFLPLIQEEFQNLIRSVAIRDIQFRKLGLKGSIGLILLLGERLLGNVLLRAEQGADALLARNKGMIVNADQFKPRTSFERNIFVNSLATVILVFVVILRKEHGGF